MNFFSIFNRNCRESARLNEDGIELKNAGVYHAALEAFSMAIYEATTGGCLEAVADAGANYATTLFHMGDTEGAAVRFRVAKKGYIELNKTCKALAMDFELWKCEAASDMFCSDADLQDIAAAAQKHRCRSLLIRINDLQKELW